jgi:gas vesicle protein
MAPYQPAIQPPSDGYQNSTTRIMLSLNLSFISELTQNNALGDGLDPLQGRKVSRVEKAKILPFAKLTETINHVDIRSLQERLAEQERRYENINRVAKDTLNPNPDHDTQLKMKELRNYSSKLRAEIDSLKDSLKRIKDEVKQITQEKNHVLTETLRSPSSVANAETLSKLQSAVFSKLQQPLEQIEKALNSERLPKQISRLLEDTKAVASPTGKQMIEALPELR